MAVVSVNAIAGSEGSVNERLERTYTRVFRVITNDRHDSAVTVGNASGIPRIGDTYVTANDFDLLALCKSVTPQQDDDNALVWIVRAEYGRFEEQEENPLARPAELSWGFAPYTRILEKDIDGNAVLNSAGQYFDPPPEVDDSRPVLSVTRNEAVFNPTLAINYQDAVNSDTFLGFTPGQAKVAGISASRVFDQTYGFYWQVSYEIHFRREGWQPQILDQGRYYLNADGQPTPIPEVDADNNEIAGSHVTDPTPLDGEGAYIQVPSPDNAVFLTFNAYRELPFSAFNF